MSLEDGKQLAELDHLIDVEDVLLQSADRWRVNAGQGIEAQFGDLHRRAQCQFPLDLKVVRDLLRALPHFVRDLNAKWQLAFELVTRADADRNRPCLAPAA